MTRLFLAAGVAALAIAAPANAGPGGHGGKGGGGGRAAQLQRGGGGGGGQRAQAAPRGGGGGGGFAGPRIERGGGGGGGGRAFAAPRMQRAERFAAPRVERAQRFSMPRAQRAERVAMRPARNERIQTRAAERQQLRANRVQQVRNERQQLRANQTQQVRNERQQLRANRMQQVRNERQQLRANQVQQVRNERQQLRANQFAQAQNGMITRQQLAGRMVNRTQMANRFATQQALNPERFSALNNGARMQILDPVRAQQFVGVPVNRVESFAALSPLPPAVSYLYPETPDYYYRYGDGYLYQVNRSDNVIAALLPLMAGGYLPGQYLPNYYMTSYVPADYGFNSFYQDYGDDCYRYGYGVVYEVDCFSGMVEDVIPLYAGGYGVGQMIPSAYSYYNVPMQYRPMYYDTADSGYWYAPGAIYQYDRGSSMITSVAALMSPGFTIGQPLPMGYDVYNVPYAYRPTYYDTPTAMYRYNNGYIYQVDPATQLVTAIVASLLT